MDSGFQSCPKLNGFWIRIRIANHNYKSKLAPRCRMHGLTKLVLLLRLYIFIFVENWILYDTIHDFSLQLRIGSYQPDISRFQSHTEKKPFTYFAAKLLCKLLYFYYQKSSIYLLAAYPPRGLQRHLRKGEGRYFFLDVIYFFRVEVSSLKLVLNLSWTYKKLH